MIVAKASLADLKSCLKENSRNSWKAKVFCSKDGSTVSYWHSKAFK